MNPTPFKEPKFDPHHVPEILTEPHPLRYGIHGDTHFIADLKGIVNASEELHESLKLFICEELDDIESNAARIDLHLVDHPHGGVSLNLHISPKHLGARKPTINKPTHRMAPAAAIDSAPKSE